MTFSPAGMIEPIRVFIGYDPKEAVAYHVCCNSIITRATRPVQIYPLALNLFASEYTEGHEDGSNEFVYSRFLVPWLCHWSGWAIYLDGDMLVRNDIAELWDRRRGDMGVQVVKHDYKTKHPVKYFGAKNEDYPRKNWSSMILWNCAYFPNRRLTPHYVSQAMGAHLHRFAWLKDEQIDAVPPTWNHLVGEYEHEPEAKLLHFTVAIPALEGYENQEGADEWRGELAKAMEPIGNEHGDRNSSSAGNGSRELASPIRSVLAHS